MKNISDVDKTKRLRYKQYIVLFFVLLSFIYIGYEYYFKYSYMIKDPNILKEVILSYGSFSILIFVMLQILQVVIFFIPGEFIQVAGGYIFGTFLGGFISLIGITAGSAIAYFIANTYGKPLVQKLLLNKKIKLFRKVLKAGSKKAVVFIFYLIPGIPKDALAYICGVSDISFKDFFIFSTLGRIPGIFISTLFGQRMFLGDSTSLITIGIVMGTLSIIGVLKGETIIKNIIKKKKTY